VRSGWRLCLMILFLAAFLATVACLNWLVNPFGAWRTTFLERIFLRMDIGTERVATPFRLRTERPSTLLVGSSRVLYGMTIEQGYRDGVLNAALPGAMLDEIDAVLRIATLNPELKHVVWGVDFYAFGERFAGSGDHKTLLRLQGDNRLLILETLLSFRALELSRRVVFRAIGGRERLPHMRVVPLPWPQDIVRDDLERSDRMGQDWPRHANASKHLSVWITNYSHYRLSAKQMSLFHREVTRVREAGVKVTLFVPPLSEYELEVIRQAGGWGAFQQWKRQLVAAGSYWDFSGYNEVASAERMFTSVEHFAPPVGHVILRHLMGEECDACGSLARRIITAGVRVDTANIDAHLATQSEAMRRSALRGSSSAQAVERVIHAEAASAVRW
jgi:hypothetical protein